MSPDYGIRRNADGGRQGTETEVVDKRSKQAVRQSSRGAWTNDIILGGMLGGGGEGERLNCGRTTGKGRSLGSPQSHAHAHASDQRKVTRRSNAAQGSSSALTYRTYSSSPLPPLEGTPHSLSFLLT